MNIQRLRDELRRHPVFIQEIPSEMNMGFPVLEKKGESIIMSFLLHEESADEQKIYFYPAAYRVSFELPSLALTEFRNLIICEGKDITEPAASTDIEYMKSAGADIIDELYRWFETTLGILPYPEYADHAIKSYQGIFKDAVEALELNGLYGDSTDEK